MNFRTTFTFVLSAGLLFGLAACKKDNDEPTPVPTLTTAQKLVNSWKFVSILDKDGKETIQPCDKDDRLIINANGTFWVKFGSVTCDTSDFKDTTLKDNAWRLFDNDKKIQVTSRFKYLIPLPGGGVQETTFVSIDTLEILDLTSSRLRTKSHGEITTMEVGN